MHAISCAQSAGSLRRGGTATVAPGRQYLGHVHRNWTGRRSPKSATRQYGVITSRTGARTRDDATARSTHRLRPPGAWQRLARGHLPDVQGHPTDLARRRQQRPHAFRYQEQICIARNGRPTPRVSRTVHRIDRVAVTASVQEATIGFPHGTVHEYEGIDASGRRRDKRGFQPPRARLTLFHLAAVHALPSIVWVESSTSQLADSKAVDLLDLFAMSDFWTRTGATRPQPCMRQPAGACRGPGYVAPESELECASYSSSSLQHGLPTPSPQFRPSWLERGPAAASTSPSNAFKVIVEVDGRRWHSRDESTSSNDRARDRAAQINGWIVSPVHMVRDHSPTHDQVVRRAPRCSPMPASPRMIRQ